MLQQGLGGMANTERRAPAQSQSSLPGSLGGLSELLGPSLLGGLAGALLTGKPLRGLAGGALLAGGGLALWNKYKSLIQANYSGAPGAQSRADAGLFPPAAARPDEPIHSSPGERAARIVRALVFAAKSDGHIDDKEQAAIYENLKKLGIGAAAQQLVSQALTEPLDPELIAKGVSNEEEALEVFAISCAVVDIDHFMERSYLEALGSALRIPGDIQKEIVEQMHARA